MAHNAINKIKYNKKMYNSNNTQHNDNLFTQTEAPQKISNY